MHITRSKKKPLSIRKVGPAQPGLFKTVTPIPSRHRARGSVLQVSAQVESDMDTWARFHPCKLGPPSVPHMPSGHSNSIFQVGYERFRSTHIHSTRPALAQSGGYLGRGTGQNPSNSVFPTHAGEWDETKAPWCSWGPAQNPGLPMGSHLGIADDTAQR
eukprot:125137-Amphidinium_carterae.1